MTPLMSRGRRVMLAALWTCVPAVAAAQGSAAPSRSSQYLDAAEGLTLEALVALAIEQAPSLAAARARIDQAAGGRTQAALRPNPSAFAERREQFGGIETQTMVGMAWPLDLSRRDARIAVADQMIRTAEAIKDDQVRERVALVRMSAAEVLAAVRQLEIAVDVARFAKARLDLLTARVDSGGARPLDRDLADVEWRRSEADVVAWQGRADRGLSELKAAVGLPAGAPLKLAAPLDAVAGGEPPLAGAAIGDVAGARPDVRALESEARVAMAEGALASREARLDLSVSASYMNRRVGLPAGNDRMHAVTVGVVIDLPWRNRQQGRIAAADAARRAAEAGAEARRIDAEAEIDAARIRERTAAATLALYRGGLMEIAVRNLTVVRESFDLGRGTLLDVIDEERRYLELQSAFTAALREVIDARTALLRATGVAS